MQIALWLSSGVLGILAVGTFNAGFPILGLILLIISLIVFFASEDWDKKRR
jgi:hypothetical protein